MSHVQPNRDQVVEFCQRWSIVELSLFGSVLREDFRPNSDVDVLVTFAPDVRWSLRDLVEMEEELKGLLGREVDLVEREAVEQSENYLRRRHALSEVETICVASAGRAPGGAEGAWSVSAWIEVASPLAGIDPSHNSPPPLRFTQGSGLRVARDDNFVIGC